MNDYQANMLKLATSHLYLQSLYSTSEQLFGKPFLQLSEVQVGIVKDTLIALLANIYPHLTPEFLGQPSKSTASSKETAIQ